MANERIQIEQRILRLLKEKSLQTITVAEKLGIERHTAVKYLEGLESKGLLKHETRRRAKLWKTAETPLVDVLKKNELLSKQLTDTFKDIDVHISIKDKNLETIWRNQHAESNQLKCHELHFKQKQKCKNCPVEKTFHSGKAEVLEIRFNDSKKKIITKPIKDDNNNIIAVVEIIK